MADVIVLNGGSSSGKSSLARSLQELLAEPWASLGVDDLLASLAPSLIGDAPPQAGRPPLMAFEPDGTVHIEPAWRPVEAAWYTGVAAMARAGLGVIVEEVLLDGGTGQRRVAGALDGLSVLWVGVRCAPAVAAEREKSRTDPIARIAGMATSQAIRVHDGVDYHVVVDATDTSSEECAGRCWTTWSGP
ncbi:MAG: phosphotransferase-like protein [Acidimicrobiales bacterium]